MSKLDMLNTMKELAAILRGEHPDWEGDRRANGYVFLVRVANDLPEEARALADDIDANVAAFVEETGVSTGTLLLASKILRGERQGAL